MHPPKIIQIWWGRHENFCVWKKSAITFGEGCTLMLDIHVHSAFMAWNLHGIPRKESSWYSTNSQKLINLDWLDFYAYVIYIQTYVDHFFFHFGNTFFFVGKKLPNLEPHPPVAMLWIANYINLWLWLIDRWNMIFYLPNAVML